MTPSARIQAAIVILDTIIEGVPAEKALTGWARKSRFAGSGDRAAIRDHVFQALRCRRSYASLGTGDTGRGLMIGALRAADMPTADFFNGQGYGPDPLSEAEAGQSQQPSGEGEEYDLPDWLIPMFINALGEDAKAVAQALRPRAAVMLRVNLRKSTRQEAIAALAEGGIEAEADDIAPTALTVTQGARRVAGSEAYQQGRVEVQDGSSQAAMETLEIAPGITVLDYCAGGGGKTLALAARAQAEWVAYDADADRMKDLPERAKRAGVEVCLLEDATAQAPYDLVLCDAPCSGSGAWRRSPDAKWRLTPERLNELTALQDQILREAAQLVGVGGKLIYATCSILSVENQDRIAQFLAATPGWRADLQRHWPVSDGGDGFFIAHLKRFEIK
jgi:16S rRNA (cytosine967-C5)-methyltransferase